jgi:excisionase family DNA binding protein
MTITTMQETLDEIERLVKNRRYDEIEAVVQRARRDLGNERLLTTREASRCLGIGSVNTIKAMARAGKIGYVMHGSHMRIPLAEVRRAQDSAVIRDLQAMERLHDATAMLGSDEGMNDEELAALSASRPGKAPWER